jgi:hypothetical protein
MAASRTMAVVELFLDESGYTGPDLINRDQPFFTLASTNVSEADARSLLSSCFGVRKGEVKFANLAKRERGRAQIVEFVRALDLSRGNCAFFSYHKQFLLCAYLIDFWLEPMMHEDGVNLYERGANIALNNVSYLTLGTCLGLDGRRELLRKFQVMTRDRTRFTFDSFWDSLERVTREHDLLRELFRGLLVARSRLGYRHLVRLPAGMLDLGDYGLLETVQDWRKKLPGEEFVVVHDESKFLRKQREFWEAVLSQANPPAVVGQDRRIIEFPLPVKELHLEDSQKFPQLQVADLIASAARAHAAGLLARTDNGFLDALVKAGLLNALAGGVWPTATVRPEELDTDGPVFPDAATHISRLLKRP